ncbi:MAG TPA: hypothetical protein VF265_02055 [Nevskiaceae bacterium]
MCVREKIKALSDYLARLVSDPCHQEPPRKKDTETPPVSGPYSAAADDRKDA